MLTSITGGHNTSTSTCLLYRLRPNPRERGSTGKGEEVVDTVCRRLWNLWGRLWYPPGDDWERAGRFAAAPIRRVHLRELSVGESSPPCQRPGARHLRKAVRIRDVPRSYPGASKRCTGA